MRDANGSGNIYFDDLFANGIPYLSLIYWCLNGTVGFTNLLLTPLFFSMAIMQQSYHRNLRLVSSNLYLAFLLSSIGSFIYSMIVITHVSDKLNDNLFTTFRFIQSMGANLWKTAFLSIILERAAATMFAKFYEHRAPFFLGVALYFIGLLGSLLPICYFMFRIHYYITIAANAALDFICWMSIFVLFWTNKKMHKIKFDATIHLSHRYQITENLRFLRIITPIIIIEGLINTIAMVLYTIEGTIDFNTILYYPSTMLLPNIYVLIFFLFYFKRDELIRRRIFKLLNFKSAIVEPLQSQIRNVIGEKLVIQNNAEIHFMELDKYWS